MSVKMVTNPLGCKGYQPPRRKYGIDKYLRRKAIRLKYCVSKSLKKDLREARSLSKAKATLKAGRMVRYRNLSSFADIAQLLEEIQPQQIHRISLVAVKHLFALELGMKVWKKLGFLEKIKFLYRSGVLMINNHLLASIGHESTRIQDEEITVIYRAVATQFFTRISRAMRFKPDGMIANERSALVVRMHRILDKAKLSTYFRLRRSTNTFDIPCAGGDTILLPTCLLILNIEPPEYLAVSGPKDPKLKDESFLRTYHSWVALVGDTENVKFGSFEDDKSVLPAYILFRSNVKKAKKALDFIVFHEYGHIHHKHEGGHDPRNWKAIRACEREADEFSVRLLGSTEGAEHLFDITRNHFPWMARMFSTLTHYSDATRTKHLKSLDIDMKGTG